MNIESIQHILVKYRQNEASCTKCYLILLYIGSVSDVIVGTIPDYILYPSSNVISTDNLPAKTSLVIGRVTLLQYNVARATRYNHIDR